MKKKYIVPRSEIFETMEEKPLMKGTTDEVFGKNYDFGDDGDGNNGWWSDSVNDYTNMWLKNGEK